MSAYETIVSQLNLSFDIENIFLENESFMHNVPPNSETHFKLVIVSNDFTELTNLKRHQCIYKALNDTMTRIHALSIQAFTPDEYLQNPIILKTPDCANK
jgi:BolA protein